MVKDTKTTAVPDIGDLKPFIPLTPQQGWQCPICHAVMSPWMSCCINCTGSNKWDITFKPYQVTCAAKGDTNV